MKKMVIISIAMTIALSLAACGGSTSGSNNQSEQGSISEAQEKILASVDAILGNIESANAEIEKIGSYMQQGNFTAALSSIGTARTEFQKAAEECGDTEDFAKMKGILQSICSKLNVLSSSSGADSGIEDKISSVLDGCETLFESMGNEIEGTWVKKYNLSDGTDNS